MFRDSILIFTSVILYCTTIAQCDTSNDYVLDEARKFPDGFMFGTATSSYQIEGAWDADGKSENIWDRVVHTKPAVIKDGSNGDIADNSYYLYKKDVEIMKDLGVDFYRFSLSWTRILPTSFPDKVNPAGIEYYNYLINELLKNNIEPVVTLYHWDLPQKLQEMGGWTNPYIVNWFEDYARVAFENFGDRVKYWITINEPHQVCFYAYGESYLAPMLNIKGIAEYMCAKNLLLAHARAYHVYDKEFRPTMGGNIFITLSAQWYEPESEEHIAAAEDGNTFNWMQYSHPIFSKSGDFPLVMKERIAANSAAQGFRRSRLPELTPEEVEYIRGTSDFFGLNHYLTLATFRNETVKMIHDVPSFFDDINVLMYRDPKWKISDSGFTTYTPEGFYKLLTKIRNEYNPTIFITENGFANHGGLIDDDRIKYLRGYMNSILDAIDDGSNIMAYTVWSLMDNFEWWNGYIERFGLYEVDYKSEERTRTPRKSAFVYKEILRTRTLDPHYEPNIDFNTCGNGCSSDEL